MNPLINCFAMITSGDFTLKKVDVSTNPKGKKTTLQPHVSLDEILNIRQHLRSNKEDSKPSV
jgi:hypothetical protein